MTERAPWFSASEVTLAREIVDEVRFHRLRNERRLPEDRTTLSTSGRKADILAAAILREAANSQPRSET